MKVFGRNTSFWGNRGPTVGSMIQERSGDDRSRHAYNEDAFHYLLTIERKRSERSGHPFLLLLLDMKDEYGASVPIDTPVARTLFSHLWRCLRGTDLIGWYRAERVIGIVLAELTGAAVSNLVRQRLLESLPADLARLLRIRICHTPALGKLNSEHPTLGIG
jgi:hypothetical protein